MEFRTIQRIVLAKRESSYGVDPTPSLAANAIQVTGLRRNYSGEIFERNLQKATMSQDAPILGKRLMEIAFSMFLKGSGTPGTAARIGDLLRACALSETLVGGSSYAYSPTSETQDSVTLYIYDVNVAGNNFKKQVITGCRGNAVLTLDNGVPAKLDFSFRGLYAVPTDVSDPGSPTYESTLPPIVESAGASYNSVSTLVIQQLMLDFANGLVEQDDINSAGGLKGFAITSRKPNGRITPEAVLVATTDWYSDWINSTQRAITAQVGSTNGNKIAISIPKAVVENIAEEDRNGILAESIPFRCALNSGDDEFSITFS